MAAMATANKCLIFAAIAVLTNWEYAIRFNRPVGQISWSVEPIGLLLLLAVIAIPLLLIRCYRLVRTCLASGVTIPREMRLIDWRPCVLLFPLLCHVGSEAVGVAPDGALYTRTVSYGSDASFPALIAAVLLIVLYQFQAALKR